MPVQKKKQKKASTPTVIVIFGITGDLAERKLLPALFDLYVHNNLPDKFTIVGFSRRDLAGRRGDGDDKIRAFVRRVIKKKGHKHAKKDIDAFVKHVHYHQGDFTNPEDYGALAEHLMRIEKRYKRCTSKLFYLAVPPKYYNQLFRNLSYTGLTVPCHGGDTWARVLVEKPFGKDLKTAKELDKDLSLLFKEKQIFRIDHYLGKEMVQDILMFRFANSIFEPIWNSKFIERVEIKMYETLDVSNRASFYDGVGALRDVGENHALQMLALIAMDRPESFAAEDIREARAAILSKLTRMSSSRIYERTRRGQYIGYSKEKGVAKKSKTETYFRIDTRISSDRWGDVPFVIEAGKALDERRTEIDIFFRPTPALNGEQTSSNRLRFCIQPCQEIRMTFASKQPGFEYKVEEVDFVFSQMNRGSDRAPDAYEKVLYDCIMGDQTMFPSSEEVRASWKFITPILKAWEKNGVALKRYKKGSSPENI